MATKAQDTIEFHPLANVFPLMEGEPFRDLVDDIRENGLREAIWLHEDQIVDGRNRYRACREAGVAPKFRDWDGKGSLLSFVVSLNLKRRHLDEGQRAMVAARLETFKQGQRKAEMPIGISRSEAAALLSVGERTVARAAEVIKHGTPELIAAVDAGEVAVSAAAEVAALPAKEQREIVAEGAKAIKAKARELREAEASTPEPEPETFDDAAANLRLRELVKAEARKWPATRLKLFVMQLEELVDTIKAGAF